MGTSDARGCGENLHYDGLSRLTGEDYSPCLGPHLPYSDPFDGSGTGFEVVYVYDEYEAGQEESEVDFLENSRFALGQLTAVYDRGSHTRFNYDSRGRVRRVSRRMAKPLTVTGTGPTEYTDHWFKQRTDFDLADQVRRRTTGAENGSFVATGGSEEIYAYSARGLLASINSSYGPILANIAYDPDGAVNQFVYGDAASTTTTWERDERRRLKVQRTERATPGPWAAASATYALPPDGSTIPQVPAFQTVQQMDAVGNPLVIADSAQLDVPEHAAPVAQRTIEYDDFYRVSHVDYAYATATGGAEWQSPYAAEIASGNPGPVPLRTMSSRVAGQWFGYDDHGNTTYATDENYASYDRSLGSALLSHGPANDGPNQLRGAEGMTMAYDDAGNLIELRLERGGSCPSGGADRCAQFFAYDWDEVGQLAVARRWDFDGASLPTIDPGERPQAPATWELAHAYSGGVRVMTSKQGASFPERHTVDIFDTLRLRETTYSANDYAADEEITRVFVGGMAEVIADRQAVLPTPDPAKPVHVFFSLGDHLGSSSMIIDAASSELVERTTYQAYGAIESDFRPERWAAFREDFKFTGKEEDIEVGLTYFGARYYAPHLGRWASADPLTIHGLGADLNPYAYVGGRVMSHVDPFGLEDGPPRPQPGTRTNGDTEVKTTCDPGPCVDNMSRWEDSSQRGLERLSRNGASGGQSGVGGNWFGVPPDGAFTDYAIGAHRGYWTDQSEQGKLNRDIGAGVNAAALAAILLPEILEGIEELGFLGYRALTAARAVGTTVRTVQRTSATGVSIWSFGLAVRGRLVELMRGANLPRTFPVIDRFSKGIATSIKSMNLGAQSYQNPARVTSVVTGYIDKLAAFNGARLGGMVVDGASITGRTLDLVVSSQGTPAQQDALRQLGTYAQSVGVTLNVVVVP